MSLDSVRAFFAEKAPDISVIESPISSATVALAAEAYGVEPGRIAKTLSLRIGERVTPEAMALACVESDLVAPLTMFKAIRTQMDELGLAPDHRVRSLSELPAIAARP